jgi:hypothetical protein
MCNIGKVEDRPRSRVQGIRVDEAELAVYKAAAVAAGLSFNKWARLALKGQAELEAALARMEKQEARQPVMRGPG